MAGMFFRIFFIYGISLFRTQADNGSGPPPAKKAKGNPIITRYPPPPGYVPPVQQLPTPPYGQSPVWQGQTYGQPVYQQPAYATPQLSAYPPQHLVPQTYGQLQPTAQAYAPNGAWQAPAQAITHARHYSVPAVPSISLDGNGDPFPPQDLQQNDDALEHEYDEECYYARHPEQINPTLSLGAIEWKAPMPARSALPCTFQEAEMGALAPRHASARSRESVSTLCKDDEAFLSIKQTDAWSDLKSSLIFKEFPTVCNKLISLSQLLAKYRDRYDAEWAAGPRSPTPALTRAPTPERSDSRASGYSRHMEIDQQEGGVRISTEQPEVFGGQFDVLDDLEAALRTSNRHGSVTHSRAGSMAHSRAGSVAHSRAGSVNHVRAGSVTHSRAGSVTHPRNGSVYSHHRRQSSTANIPRPKALPAIRDSAQEDVLAALGVSGSPKMVYQTPGPAFGPPPPNVVQRHSRESSVASTRSTHHTSQPVILEEPDAVDAIIHRVTNGHTANNLSVYCENEEPDDNATPKPQRWQRDTTRKRSYADTQAGAQHQYDEETPKRSKPYRSDHR